MVVINADEEFLLNEPGLPNGEAVDVVAFCFEERRLSLMVAAGCSDLGKSGGWGKWGAASLPPRPYRRVLTAASLATAPTAPLPTAPLTHRALNHRTLSHRALTHQGEFSRGRVKAVCIDVAIRPSGRVWRRRQWPTAAPLNPGPPGNEAPVFTSSTTATVHANQTAAYTAVATDPDGDALTYSLEGSDALFLDIDVRDLQVSSPV